MKVNHSIDPKKKDKNWISAYIKQAWQEFKENYPGGFYNGRDDMHEVRMYMLGRQSIAKYKKLLIPEDQANDDTSWLRINWDVLSIISKIRRISIASLMKQGYSYSIKAVDSLAQTDQENARSEAEAKILLK